MAPILPEQQATAHKQLLIVDNYDSFVHTLAGYCERLGVDARVVRNDSVSLGELSAAQAVLLSPGPGSPEDAGICIDAVRHLKTTPILGICLGHQTIGVAMGARIGRTRPMHGRTSDVFHTGKRAFAGLPSPIALTRYHSLEVLAEPSDVLNVDAVTTDGIVMAISHRSRLLWGIQPHPEAVLSRMGHRILANFLSAAGFEITTSDWPESNNPQPSGETPEYPPRPDGSPDYFTQPIEAAYPLPKPRFPS